MDDGPWNRAAGRRRDAEAAAARIAAQAGRAAAAAEAARQIQNKEEQFRLEEEAASARYDKRLGPGHSSARRLASWNSFDP